MHWCTAQCKKGVKQKKQRPEAEEEKAVTSRFFSAYGRPLDMVNSFKYLGLVISATYEYWTEVVRKLAKMLEVW